MLSLQISYLKCVPYMILEIVRCLFFLADLHYLFILTMKLLSGSYSMPTLLQTGSLSLALGLCCQVFIGYHMLPMFGTNLKQRDIQHNHTLLVKYFFSRIKGELRALRELVQICHSDLLPCIAPGSAEVRLGTEHLPGAAENSLQGKWDSSAKLPVSNSLETVTASVLLQ